ncbi:hypothetical protein Pyn_23120 [Prunus yedoensis var. nudiflora]|uniref:Uncharacterized protein n=1 Tax=Prunus yedoensis var. nudiflora TaxID=2094558 RepID=A0A314Y2E8_PRUYE|nr:hypothetical protein Pyn_23120 [Prunus yedoensis var. nudiflora]
MDPKSSTLREPQVKIKTKGRPSNFDTSLSLPNPIVNHDTQLSALAIVKIETTLPKKRPPKLPVGA